MKKLYHLCVVLLCLFSFEANFAQDNVHLDCDDALLVCDDSSIGFWNDNFGVQELDDDNQGCLAGNEHQSIWITFTISSGTTLEFDILSNIEGDDYDFALYGPDAVCGDLSTPIRCDYDYTEVATGLNAAAGLGYDTTLNVQAGETYYLLIDNHPAGDQSGGFRLNWGGNAVLDCCPQDPVVFNFEDEDGNEQTEFCLGDDVFLDGSLTLDTANYFIDIWIVNDDGTLSWLQDQNVNGWASGTPDLVNITQLFENDPEQPVTFYAGVTYAVKLAIVVPDGCGWSELLHQFTYIDCCPPSISSGFTLEYECDGDSYSVTVTANDPVPSQWWGLYETSVEGSTSDANTVFPMLENQTGITTATFTGLSFDTNYYVKHGVWIDGCFEWQETRIALDRDCCTDEPYIEPYWEFCEGPNPCEFENPWPIRVLDAAGNHITLADGVTFDWSSSNGGTSNSDVVYAVAFEEWTVKLVFPDGCIYTATYKQICCEEDIHIEIDDCPSADLIIALQEELERSSTRVSPEDQIRYEAAFEAYAARDNDRAAPAACDPCDIGLVVMRVVDGDGNLVTNFESIVWGDGLATDSNIRLGLVNTTYTVTVTQLVNDGQDICTYTDTFFYECEGDCDSLAAPTNLQVTGTTLSWDPVPGADEYLISSPGAGPIIFCDCPAQVSVAPFTVDTNSVTLTGGLASACFIWQVTAICADGSQSPTSGQMCYPNEGGGHDGTSKALANAKVTPNPTNGNMTFTIDVNYDTDVQIEIYNFSGILIKSFNNQVTKDSDNTMTWNAAGLLPRGIYFVQFKTPNEIIQKKLIIN